MASSLSQLIAAKVSPAAQAYYQLVLVVGPHRSGKTAAFVELELEQGWPLININLLLSERLLELTTRQRALRADRIINDIVSENDAGVIMLDNIEMLFHPALKLNPLHLLYSLSRNRTIVATWRGAAAGGSLVYGSSEHPEYRKYEDVQALVITS